VSSWEFRLYALSNAFPVPFFVIVPIVLDVSITVVREYLQTAFVGEISLNHLPVILNFKRWKTGLPAADALLRHVSYLAFEAAALPTVARFAAGIGWFAHVRPFGHLQYNFTVILLTSSASSSFTPSPSSAV